MALSPGCHHIVWRAGAGTGGLDPLSAGALLGPHQVGKTTLALQLTATTPSLDLDPEASAARGSPTAASCCSAPPQWS